MIQRFFARTWDTIAAFIAAVAAARWLSSSVIDSITTELIAFFTIQSAVILPAMIFTAGLLKGDSLTVVEVKRFQVALKRQMQFWVTLLSFDLIAVAALIAGKAANWTLRASIADMNISLGWLLVAIAAFTGVLAILRMVPFVSGVVSLLDLNGWLALKAVQAREKEMAKAGEAIEPVSPFEQPEGYGRILPPTEH